MHTRFRLQGLLKMYERKRDECQTQVHRKEEHVRLAEVEIRLLWEEMERARGHFQDSLHQGPCPQTLSGTLQHLERRRAVVATMLALRRELLGQLEALQAELLEARRDVRRLEILRDRQFEEQRLLALTQQQAALDELAGMRHLRRSS